MLHPLREELRAGPLPLHIAFRTRNPRVWSLCAARCLRIVPGFGRAEDDPKLVALAGRVAGELFPQTAIELPSLVMRDAYTDFVYKRQPEHDEDDLNRRFFDLLTGERDVVFALGELDSSLLLEGARVVGRQRSFVTPKG